MEFLVEPTIQTEKRSVQTRSFLEPNPVVSEMGGAIHHQNYLEYLITCWANHYNAVIKPDYFWHIILCEVATHIKDNSQKYRHLFTDSDTKKDIIVVTADPQVLPLAAIVEQLNKLLPVGGEAFINDFSTSTRLSKMASYAAFADAMSPYYNYMMLLCGIPKIKIEGTNEDWEKIRKSIDTFMTYFDAKFNTYLAGVYDIISKIIDANNGGEHEFLKNILKYERCGSGSAMEVNGWIQHMFYSQKRPRYSSNFPTCNSLVEYKNLTTNKEYKMITGLFGSDLNEEGYLIPEFGYAVYEKK